MTIRKRIGLGVLGVLFFPLLALAAVTDLNGQTGATQTFVDDTNVTITSSADTHTLGWSGLLAPDRGGTGSDLSAFTTGSVLFWDGSEVSEDTNLVWDDMNSKLSLSGSVSFFSDSIPSDKTIYVENQTNTNTDGNNLVLRSGRGLGYGNSGDIKLIAADAADDVGSIGGDILIRSGSGNGYGTANGGITLQTADVGENEAWSGISILGGSFGFDNTGMAPTQVQMILGNGIVDGAGGGGFVFSDGSATTGNADGGGFTFNLGYGSGTGNAGNYTIYLASSSGTGEDSKFIIVNPDSYKSIMNFENVTSDQTYTFPDASGTFSLLESTQEFTGINTFSNPVNNFISASNSTVHIGADGFPGCIVIGDDDSSGVTYITADNGVLSTSSSPPANCN